VIRVVTTVEYYIVGYKPLLIFGSERRFWMPKVYRTIPEGTPYISVDGLSQEGVLE